VESKPIITPACELSASRTAEITPSVGPAYGLLPVDCASP